MNKKDEALKMAIEALEDSLTRQDVAINACKEALEQPSKNIMENYKEMIKEKVDMQRRFRELPIGIDAFPEKSTQNIVTVPTMIGSIQYERLAPWQGLSDDEMLDIADKSWEGISPHADTMNFARAIEQALKEKNCSF